MGYAINRFSAFSGHSQIDNTQQRAFLYRSGRNRDLGTLGGDASFDFAINDRGVVADTQIV